MAAHPRTSRPVSELKLGALPRVIDPRTLDLAAYVDLAKLPTPPDHLDPPPVGIRPMYANDTLGDCTAAALGHLDIDWSFEADGKAVTPSLQAVEDFYARCNDYPDFAHMPASAYDNGAVILDVLKRARQEGLGGDKILGFVAVPIARHDLVKVGAYLFGGLDTGVALPLSAQAQTPLGTWDVVPGPDAQAGSWGGHSVSLHGYATDGVVVCSWGELVHVTWAFWDAYFTEAYAILPGEDATFAGRQDAHGLNLGQLQDDLRRL
jgi:hypothetical protein